MKIKGAIFDMDGTLVDSLMFWDEFWKSINAIYIKQEDFTPAPELDKEVRTMIFADAISAIKEQYSIAAPIEELWDFANKGVEDHYRYVATLKDGANELLDFLRAKGIGICLASATQRKYITIAVEAFGLSDKLDFMLSCCEIGVGKDRPDIYLLAKEKLGCEASEICVFEDSCVALETARKAGFKTAGLYDKYNNYNADRLRAASDIYMGEGEDLSDLIKYIE